MKTRAILQAIGVCLFTLAGSAAAVEEGQVAPDFTLPDMHDPSTQVRLEDLRGQVVYVDFWASWCAPCLRSLPQINELYARYKDQGFEVVAVNVDDPVENGQEFLLDTPLDYQVVADPDSRTPELYGVYGMPTSYLIDAEGVVRLVHMGFREGDIDIIEAAVTDLLDAQ